MHEMEISSVIMQILPCGDEYLDRLSINLELI